MAGTLWGSLDGEGNLPRRGSWCSGIVKFSPREPLSRTVPAVQVGWSSVLQGMSACQEGFPQRFLLSNTLCFDGDTHVCALTGVSENTGLTSGAGNSEEFSMCSFRSGESVVLENA